MHAATVPTVHGLIAEFEEPETILEAAQKATDAGYTKMDAYTPFPVHGLAEAIKFQDALVPWTVFICGVLGAIGGFALQIYTLAIDYPLNVGGRPMISWPSFIPVAFECTILLAAGSAVVGMFLYNGLPRPHHPIFNAPNFERASQDRFFLCIESGDPRFDIEQTEAFLRTLGPNAVSVVEN